MQGMSNSVLTVNDLRGKLKYLSPNTFLCDKLTRQLLKVCFGMTRPSVYSCKFVFFPVICTLIIGLHFNSMFQLSARVRACTRACRNISVTRGQR